MGLFSSFLFHLVSFPLFCVLSQDHTAHELVQGNHQIATFELKALKLCLFRKHTALTCRMSSVSAQGLSAHIPGGPSHCHLWPARTTPSILPPMHLSDCTPRTPEKGLHVTVRYRKLRLNPSNSFWMRVKSQKRWQMSPDLWLPLWAPCMFLSRVTSIQKALCKVKKWICSKWMCKFAGSHIFLQCFTSINVLQVLFDSDIAYREPVNTFNLPGVISLSSPSGDRDTPMKGQ